MRIQWGPYVRQAPREAQPHEIEALEQCWGVILPDSYKQLIATHQGMTPKPSRFDVGRGQNSLCALLTITRDERWDEYSILGTHESLKKYVPDGIYPFGTTPGGESLCFDYRNNGNDPGIVLVTVEGNIHRVAENFSGFLASLHD